MTEPSGSDEPRKIVIRAPSPDAPPPQQASTPRREGVAPADASPHPSPAAEAARSIDWGLLLASLGGAIAALSPLFPWWTRTYKSIQLLDSDVMAVETIPGLIAIVAGWVLLLGLAYDNLKPEGTLAATIAACGALVLTLVGAAAILAPSTLVESVEGLSVSPALGSWMALAGGVLGLIGCWMLFSERR